MLVLALKLLAVPFGVMTCPAEVERIVLLPGVPFGNVTTEPAVNAIELLDTVFNVTVDPFEEITPVVPAVPVV